MNYQFVLRLQDMMSGPLARVSAMYGRSVSQWEGLTRRFQSSFSRAAQSVEQLKRKFNFGREGASVDALRTKLDTLTKRRDLSVNTSEIKAANREIDQLERKMAKLQGKGQKGAGGGSGSMMAMVGRGALPYLGAAAIGAGAVSGFTDYAQIDSLKRGLANIEGSQAGADRRFTELRQVAALPGLGLEEAMMGDVRLRSIGFSADQSKGAMTQVGNALALTGGGKEDFGNIMTQFGQMASKSSVLTEDLKPILNSSPAIAKAVKDMFGTVNAEDISDKLQASGKGPMEFIDMLTAKLSTLERVSSGPKNAIENLGDSVKIAAYNAGLALDKRLDITGKIDAVGNGITWLSDQVEPMLQKMQPVFTVLQTGFQSLWAATAPVRDLFSDLWNWVVNLVAGIGGLGGATTGLRVLFDYLAEVVWVVSTGINWLGSLFLWIADSPFGLLVAGIWAATYAWGALNAVWLVSPVGLVVAGIVAVVAAIRYAWEHFDGFREMIIRTWAIIKSIFGSMGKVLLAVVMPTPGNIKNALSAVKGGFSEAFAAGDAAVKADRASRQAAKAEKIAKAAGVPKPGVGKPNPAGGASDIGKAGGVKSGVEGAKSTHITINLKSLNEGGIHVHATSVDEGLVGLEQKIIDLMVRAVNSGNALAT